MKLTLLAAGMVLAIYGGPTLAQTFLKADNTVVQPQVRRDASGFVACGVRAIVITSGPTNFEAYDFSVSVDAEMFMGLLKAGRRTVSVADAAKNKLPKEADYPGPVDFWFAGESKGKALRPLKIMPSDDRGFVLGYGDVVQSFETIVDIASGERMQLSLKYKSDRYERVVAYQAKLSDDEDKALQACISGIIERMQAKAKSSQ